tara:strand:+ start:700 stop:1263 length:564 start_codon:yes stop_codon:yes gene_type:complete
VSAFYAGVLLTLVVGVAWGGTGDVIQGYSTLSGPDLQRLLRSSIHSADVQQAIRRRTTRDADEAVIRRMSIHPDEVASRIRTATRFSASVMAHLNRITEFSEAERTRIDAEFRPDPSFSALGSPSVIRAPQFTKAELSRIRDGSTGGGYGRMFRDFDKGSSLLRRLLQNRSVAQQDKLETFSSRSSD